jgi:UDP-N-acetylglucosamine/UDP-N-acetylgalactosamine diphosphorylase
MIRLSSEADRVLAAKVTEAAQEQVLSFWEGLEPQGQAELLEQLRALDLQLVRKLVAQYLQGTQEVLEARVLAPAPLLPRPSPDAPESRAAEEEARAVGEEALRKGAIGIVTAAGEMAGGETDQPKGLYPVGPVSGKTLFRLHAEKIRAIARRYRMGLPWIVVTSPGNHEATTSHFRDNDFFGLNKSDVIFITQGELPVVNFRGKILLSGPSRIAMSPNGHGGVLTRFIADDPFGGLEVRGIEHIFYFQVDNPLARIADPAFLGHHILQGCDVSSKAVCKVDPEERVGIFCRCNGTLGVIEHRELPDEDRLRRGEDGGLEFCAANIGIHAFSMAFLRRLREEGVELGYHFATGRTPYIDRKGHRVVPRQANSVRFETFIFDTLAFARTTLVQEAGREDEFSPVKALTGRDSIVTAKRDLSRLYLKWIRQAESVPAATAAGDAGPVEISPLYALDAEELKAKVEGPIALRPGLYLE